MWSRLRPHRGPGFGAAPSGRSCTSFVIVPFPRLLAFAPLALAALACGSSGKTPAVAMMPCPPPMGPIPKEDCAEIADDFGALQVGGALQLAGTRKGVEPRLEAIRAVATLADTIKDRRVKLCESYVKCRVPVAGA